MRRLSKFIQNVFGAVFLGVFVLFSFATMAGEQGFKTTITEIFTDPSLFGGCGAYLERATDLGDCSAYPRYVTFDCLNTSARVPTKTSNLLLNQANLALVTGNQVYVYITESIVLDGICFADRINVLDPNRTD